jgi:ADP-dependent phosphofructokinase/glucokinase
MIEAWKNHYQKVPSTLAQFKNITGVASVFNANIDAVIHVSPASLRAWWEKCGKPDISSSSLKEIKSAGDAIRGLVECIKGGIAQEWLVTDTSAYEWLQTSVGYDRLQMGGQGGIIANVMSVCDIQNVYVHTASHGQEQAQLFLDKANLQTTNGQGQMAKAKTTIRPNEKPLIHWILEFSKGDVFEIGTESFTCPKSNRFIATYDPLNFDLHLVEAFSQAMQKPTTPLDVVLMSGFHMLSPSLSNGKSGLDRVQEVWNEVETWKASHPQCLVHLEFASTQDLSIRKAIADIVAPKVDSIGLNEQELIDILEILGEKELALKCRQTMDSIHMFKGCERLFKEFKPYRLQLHMFGFYFTLTSETRPEKLEAMRDGMACAATLAAAKAGTGSLEDPQNLLWAHGKSIWGAAVEEMARLSSSLKQQFNIDAFELTGIAQLPEFSIVALPTILVEKPVTLVGMGDTISSLSLVGSLV